MSKVVFLNGRFIKNKDAKISVFNRGFLYGEGVFETMRSYDGIIFKLDEHMDRLFNSAKLVYLNIPYNKKKLKECVELTLKKNALKDAYVRVAVWRKEEGFGLDFKSEKSDLLVLARPLKSFNKKIYENGINALALKDIRKNEKSALSGIKSFNYLDNILARKKAMAQGADDAIFLNSSGFISEATSSNIFIVKKGILVTSPGNSGILCGIARKVVLDIAKQYSIDAQERNFKIKELLRADEAFLTNSLMEVVPLVKIDKKRIGSGAPGELTRRLAALYRLEAEKKATCGI